ncbi:MAG: diguanylate cyclase, partial [Clostridia bacterium]|nr:diguanylate cyclase [Clostridia bacterium]
AILYVVVLVKRAANCHDQLIRVSLAVFACLGWWAFCDAFFYVAPTVEQAWLWMRLGALGWSGFIPVTAYFFMVMCGDTEYLNNWFRRALYWIPGITVTFLFMITDSTVLADELVPSKSGLGWAYRQSFDSFWPYLLFLELGSYLGVALIRLYLWQRHAKQDDIKKLSTGFIILDVASIAVGILVIFVIPQFSTYFPPMSFIATLIFLWGYWNELRNHDLMHIELALDPGSIFESSMDAMLITDFEWNILYANDEAKRILGTDEPKGKSFSESLLQEGRVLLQEFAYSGKDHSSGMDLILSNHIPLLCSVNRTMTRKRGHQVFIISLHDASSLKAAQKKLDYLAHYDELTGLPNRRKLGELLDKWEEQYIKTGGDFSILFLDLNRFKLINDYYGHAAGDLALKATAEALNSCIPKEDMVTRLAGDEFIVLHATGLLSTEELAEMIRKAVQNIDCSSFAPGNRMETSVGYCRYSEAGSVRELFKLADERMYAIKNKRHAAV